MTITLTDLNNAQTDVNHISTVATSVALTATDRLGHTKDTVAGALYKIGGITNRGAWAGPGTVYASKDIAQQSGTWYICTVPHTSSASFATDSPLYWRVYQGVTSGDLAASGGSALVNHIDSGAGAVPRPVQSRLRDSVSVFGYMTAVQISDVQARTVAQDVRNAVMGVIAAVAAAGGGFVHMPSGTYLFGSNWQVPSNVVLVGDGKGNTILKRGFTGDFLTSLGGYAGLQHLTIDGDTATRGTGRGVIMAPSPSPNSHMLLAEIKNFNQACLEFGADAGSTFRCHMCDFYTTGALGTVAAVRVNGTDTASTDRHFTDCESGGCTLYDFGGCNDLSVTGGYTNGLIFGAASSKVMLSNVRVGAAAGAVTVSGTSHKLKGAVFACPVTLDSTTANLDFDCEVPSWGITDNGTSNLVRTGLVAFTPTWGSSGTAPALGNGDLRGTYQRNGTMVFATYQLTIGSTTTLGSGSYTFTLPRADYASAVVVNGGGFTQTGVANQDKQFICRVKGTGVVEMFYVDGTGTLQQLGAASSTYPSGTVIRFSLTYFTK